MVNLMKEYHKKFNSLNKLKLQKESNKKRKTRSVNQCW